MSDSVNRPTFGKLMESKPRKGDVGVAAPSQTGQKLELTKFAQLYADAWCSQNPERVAAFYAKNGSISVNGAPPVSIEEVASGFMRDFPDMVVTFDKLENTPGGKKFDWTFTGTNTGPGGTGNRVRISGYEVWQFDDDGLIARSEGNFDAAEYERQLRGG